MHNLIPNSSKQDIKTRLMPKDRFSKGDQWNSTLIPFIEKEWNVKEAMANSYSLHKMCRRLSDWCAESQPSN